MSSSRGSDTPGRLSAAGLMLAAVLLVAANLRSPLTGLGPVLDRIGADTGMGPAALGLLAAVPLLAFAGVSPLAHRLGARLGLERAVLVSLLVLGIGTAVRSLPGPLVSLWLGMALAGSAIAVMNVLLPAVLKRDAPDRVAGLTAAYTSVMGACAALSSGLAVPLAQLNPDGMLGGWRIALLAGGTLILPAALLWWRFTARVAAPALSAAPSRAVPAGRILRSPLAWQVTGFMALQSTSFYIQLTWMAQIGQSLGRSPVAAGADVLLFQLAGIGGSLMTPVLLRGRTMPLAVGGPPVLALAALLSLLLFDPPFLVWVLLSGFGAGSSLVSALSMFALRTRTAAEASALSGMAQTLGYLIAAAGPIVFGALHTLTGGWTVPLLMLAGGLVAQCTLGLLVARDRKA